MRSWILGGIALVVIAGLVWGGLTYRDRTFAWEDCEAPRVDVGAALVELNEWSEDLELVSVGNVDFPVAMIPAGDPLGSNYLVTTLAGGLLELDIESGETNELLNFADEIIVGDEQGLLGIALSPSSEFLYLTFTDTEGTLTLVEYEYPMLTERRLVMTVPQPQRWHNGGNLLFGPDGYLYMALGDGGGKADKYNNGQDLSSVKGSVIRIDPRPSGDQRYTIPPDNPFVDGDAPEIWVYGLRNPWRIWFDEGDLWIGDVGQNCVEEINVVHAGESGLNFGWPALEGNMRVRGPIPSGAVDPVLFYDHDPYGCSISGGGVYRGSAMPELQGMYIWADYCNGRVRALDPGDGSVYELGVREPLTVSFGFDVDGEPYLLTREDGILKLQTR